MTTKGLGLRLGAMVMVRVRAKARAKVKVRARFRVRVRVRVKVRVRMIIKVRVRVRVRKSRSTPKHNRILSTVTTKYIGIFVIKNPSSGIWSCPFSIIATKTFHNACDVIEVYVSDVIGRGFKKLKNGHIFENWTPI